MSEVNWKVDWSKIKAEYITGTDTSYRKLAEKYGIHESVITKRAVAEKWYPAKRNTIVNWWQKRLPNHRKKKSTGSQSFRQLQAQWLM